MSNDLLPCPFCEAALVWSDTYSEYHHPVAKCILSGHKFKKGMIGQWNRRVLPAVQPGPQRLRKLLDDIIDEYDGHMFGPIMTSINDARAELDDG